MERAELIVHPVRLRIIHAFSGDRALTTSDLCQALPDVSKATIYRHVALLADHGVLETIEERRIRGTVERLFRLNRAAASIGVDHAAAATLSDHRTAFTVAMTALIAEFGAYLDTPDADPTADLVGYRQTSIWLSPDEVHSLIASLQGAIAPFLANAPQDGRTRHMLSPILFPTAG